MSEWRPVQIGALGRVVTGATPRTGDDAAWGDQIDFITPTEMDYSNRRPNNPRRLSSAGYEALQSRALPSRSILFACIGFSTGKVALTSAPAITNQQVNSLVPNPGIADTDFAYYLLRFHAPRIRHIASGSTTPIVNKSTFSAFEVRIPSLPLQRLIAGLLGALDDKIAANDRIVATADKLRTLRLSAFLDSESEDAQERPLSSIANFVNGRAFTKDATGTGRMVVRIAELNSGPGGSTVYNDIEVPEQHLARPGDVLFAWSGSLTVARWFRPEAIINQHIFKVLPIDGVPTWLAFELVQAKLAVFKGIAADKATTMGHIQRHHLDEPVTAPLENQIAKLDAELGPLWDRALLAEQETQMLAELRDTLLSKLMSGEIKVQDAEKMVGEAV